MKQTFTLLVAFVCILGYSQNAPRQQKTTTLKTTGLKTAKNLAVTTPTTIYSKYGIDATTLILSENFDSTEITANGWYVEEVENNYPDYTSTWYTTSSPSNPSISPVQGDGLAYFNSAQIPYSKARLVKDSIDLSDVTNSALLSFFMYHDDYYDSFANEKLTIQISTDSVNWTSISESIDRGIPGINTGWYEHYFDLSEYAGTENIYIGLLGAGSYWHSNIQIDSLRVFETTLSASLPEASVQDILDKSGVGATIYGMAVANDESANVAFEYDTLTDFSTATTVNLEDIGGYFPILLNTDLTNLLPEHTYYYRMLVSNSIGDSISEYNSFATSSVAAPYVDYIDVEGNDGVELFILAGVEGSDDYTDVKLLYGLDSSLSETFTPVVNNFTTYEDLELTLNSLIEDTTYYYMMVVSNSQGYDSTNIFNVKTAKDILYDSIVNNDVFLKGRYINLGIGEGGFLGTSSNGLPDMHARESNVNDYTGAIGFVADPDRDGWYSGSPNYIGDYFLPGSPEEGWGLFVNDTNLNNNGDSPINIAGAHDRSIDSAGFLIADWIGNASGLDILQRVKLPKDSLYFVFEVTLTNTTDSVMHNFYYMRNVDPDNEHNNTNDFSTLNTIVYNNFEPKDNDRALVTAVGPVYGAFIGLCANDSRARVTYGNFANREPKAIWEASYSNLYSEGSMFDDIAISIAFKIDSLEPGACTTLIYAYVLSEDYVESALRATMLEIGSSGESGSEGNTIEVCYGKDAVLTIEGGEDYSWIWTDESNAVVSTEKDLTLTNVTEDAIYTATGTLYCIVDSFKVNVTTSEVPAATISNETQLIYSGDAFTTIELNSNVDGTFYTWMRTNPSEITSDLQLEDTIEAGNNLDGLPMVNNGASNVDVDFTIIPVGPTIAACKGEEVTAKITVRPFTASLGETEVAKYAIYPNPNNGIFIISNDRLIEGTKIEILNQVGQIVYNSTMINENESIDLSGMNSGIYIINIIQDNYSEQHKIIIQ